MDKSWMKLSRVSDEYMVGVDRFLEFAFSNTTDPRIPCPCKNCLNRTYQTRGVVRSHLIIKGILPYYNVWSHHGEMYIPRDHQNQTTVSSPENLEVVGDNFHGLIEDAMRNFESGLQHDEAEEWTIPKFEDISEQARKNRAQNELKQTCGSESVPKKRYKKIKETGRMPDEITMFKDTHTSKKTKSFIGEKSREVVEQMEALAKEHTNESDTCSLSSQQILETILPGTKGTLRMRGKAVPKKRVFIDEQYLERVRDETKRKITEEVSRQMREDMNQMMQELELQAERMHQEAIRKMEEAERRHQDAFRKMEKDREREAQQRQVTIREMVASLLAQGNIRPALQDMKLSQPPPPHDKDENREQR